MPQDQPPPNQPSPPTSTQTHKQDISQFISNKKKLIFLLFVFIVFFFATSAVMLQQSRTQPTSRIIDVNVTPTPKLTQTPTSNPTANWKTYRNEEYGFEIKYPESFYKKPKKINDDELFRISNYPDFEKTENAMIFDIRLVNFKTTSSVILPKLVKHGENDTIDILNKRLDFQNFKKRFTTQILGTFLGDPPLGHYLIYVKVPNTQNLYLAISIQTHRWENPAYGGNFEDSNNALQILSTFKFLDKAITTDDLSSWKTHTNKDYQFSLQYPDDWNIKEEYWPERGDYYDVLHISLGPKDYGWDIGRFLRIVDDMSIDGVIKSMNKKSSQYHSTTEVISSNNTYFLGYPAKDVTTRYTQLDSVTDTNRVYESRYLIFQKDDLTYIFYRSNDKSSISDQILSTFEFLD